MIGNGFLPPSFLVFAILLLILSLQPAVALDVCVGEKISLAGISWHARDKDTNDLSDLRNIAIKNFVVVDTPGAPVVETGTLTELAVSDDPGISTSMDFYFSRPGTYQIIVKQADGTTDDVVYNVAMPTVTMTNRHVSTVNMVDDNGAPGLEFGNTDIDLAGVELAFAITMGSCSGEVGDAQLTSFNDVADSGAKAIRHRSTDAQAVLDFDPEETSNWHYDFRTEKNTGDQFNERFDDSPIIYLTDTMLCKSSVNQFRYLLFFRPDSGESVWIPFALFDWTLKMGVSRENTGVDWLIGPVDVSSEVYVAEDFTNIIGEWPSWSTYESAIKWADGEAECWSN